MHVTHRIGAVVVAAMVAMGCSGSGDEGTFVDTPEFLAAQCIAFNVDDLEDVVLGLFGLAEDLDENPLPANITYNSVTGDYTIVVMVGGGGVQISGTITGGDDLTDGFAQGESFDATWNYLGSGSFTVTNNSATDYRVQGIGMISSLAECNTQITAVDVNINPTNAANLTVTGTIQFTATVQNGEIVQGTITFDGSSVAQVNATFMGNNVSFGIDLDDFTPLGV